MNESGFLATFNIVTHPSFLFLKLDHLVVQRFLFFLVIKPFIPTFLLFLIEISSVWQAFIRTHTNSYSSFHTHIRCHFLQEDYLTISLSPSPSCSLFSPGPWTSRYHGTYHMFWNDSSYESLFSTVCKILWSSAWVLFFIVSPGVKIVGPRIPHEQYICQSIYWGIVALRTRKLNFWTSKWTQIFQFLKL